MTLYQKALSIPANARLALAAFLIWLLGGCWAATPDYHTYVKAQSEANAAHVQKPLLVLEGHNGQPITGLARVEVNMPTNAPVIQQARENEWARVTGQALGIVGAIGGVVATGQAMKGVAEAVGGMAQTPQANITTTNTTTNTSSVDSSVNGSYNPNTPTTINNSYNPNNAVTTYPVAP